MTTQRASGVRTAVKQAAHLVAMVVAAPLGLACAIEKRVLPGHEGMFRLCTDTMALVPGPLGVILRRAFYRMALDQCHAECYISFGAMFTHRETIVERGVYLGMWALVGSARLCEGTSIGSRASLLSGTELHEFVDDKWTPYDHGRLRQIVLGPHALIGEGAIVMADVGPSAMVAAGAVVSSKVAGGVVVAGNPARFVRRLETQRPDSAPDVAMGR